MVRLNLALYYFILFYIILETHRKYTIITALLRGATQDYKVPGESLTIEKGQKILIPIYSIHHDPKYYPNPDTFDPERFTTEEKSKRPNGTFLPFGDGPRHCIGTYIDVPNISKIYITLLALNHYSL